MSILYLTYRLNLEIKDFVNVLEKIKIKNFQQIAKNRRGIDESTFNDFEEDSDQLIEEYPNKNQLKTRVAIDSDDDGEIDGYGFDIDGMV